jgi:hypothetical protein
VVQIRKKDDLRPRSNTTPTANLGPFRIRRFAGSVAGGPQEADAATANREAFMADLPDFLRRSRVGHHEGEALFLATLAEMHKNGHLDAPTVRPGDVAQSVRSALARAEHDTPRHVSIATGSSVVTVSHGMPTVVISVDGVDPDAILDWQPTLADSSTKRERLRRFRGAIGLGGLGAPLPENPADVSAAFPDAVEVRVFSEDTGLVFTRTCAVDVL